MDPATQIKNNLGLSDNISISKIEYNSVVIIEAIITTRSLKDAAALLGISEDTFEQWLRRHGKYIFNKPHKGKWYSHLLSFVNLKLCNKCGSIKTLDKFVRCNSGQYVLPIKALCKECESKRVSAYYWANKSVRNEYSRNHYKNNKAYYSAKARKRKADLIYRTPKWADLKKIQAIYASRVMGQHIDHIVPLRGATVCGLHVENNLRVISAEDNRIKSNKLIQELIEGTEVGSSNSLENYSNQ